MLLVLAVYIQYILHVLRTHSMYSMKNDAVSLPISLSILVPISLYIYIYILYTINQYTSIHIVCIYVPVNSQYILLYIPFHPVRICIVNIYIYILILIYSLPTSTYVCVPLFLYTSTCCL